MLLLQPRGQVPPGLRPNASWNEAKPVATPVAVGTAISSRKKAYLECAAKNSKMSGMPIEITLP